MAKDLPSLDILGSLPKVPSDLPRTQPEQPGNALKASSLESAASTAQSLEVNASSASSATSELATSYSSLFDLSKSDTEGTGQNLTSTPSSFWKDGQASQAIDSLMAGSTGINQPKFGINSSKRKNIFLIAAAVILMGLAGIFVLDPEALTSLTSGFSGGSTTEDDVPLDTPTKVAQNEVPKQVLEKPIPAMQAAVDQGSEMLNWKENPYWNLPNGFDVTPTRPSQQWNAQQEDVWSSSVTGPKMWPRYMSLFEIKKMPVAGAEKVLWEFSVGKKFWLRIMALMALSDFGEVVELGHVEQAINNVHPELISRFVSRFEKTSTNGERFILRYLIRLVNEDTRLGILKGLLRSSDKYSRLYLAAGVFDPGVSVSRFSRSRSSQFGKDEMARYNRVIQGLEAFEQQVEQKPTDSATDVDPNKQAAASIAADAANPGSSATQDAELNAKEGDLGAASETKVDALEAEANSIEGDSSVEKSEGN